MAIMIDFTKSIRPGSIHSTSIPGSVFFRDSSSLWVVPERCPHRGASLKSGRVEEGCIRCPYHHRLVPGAEVQSSHGIIWWNTHDDFTPPSLSEWSDSDFKTFEYSRQVVSDPSVMIENLLDFEHVDAVHAFSLKRGTTPNIVKIYGDPNSRHGYALYDYGPGFLLENEFWLPYTNVLRFKIGDQVLCLWSSLTPMPNRTLYIHFRVSRNGYKWIPEGIIKLINDFVLSEDRHIVKDIDVNFKGNLAHPADSFVALYRRMMDDVHQTKNGECSNN
jgi:phenylpropionate dioxygenase-like ring-hydroxylating dioxygenase large terminal subunit